MDALASVGRKGEAVFVSPSLPGVMAAVRAGLGVTVRTPLVEKEGVVLLEGPDWPPLPEVEIALHFNKSRATSRSTVFQMLRNILRESAQAS